MEEIMEKKEQEMEMRPIDVITAEILLYKNQAGEAILEIGRRLNEAKAQLMHGEWQAFLAEKVDFSEATAQRFMRLAREYENPSPVTDLGASKALILLALPAVERDDFVAEKHVVNGEEKTVAEMSKRELEKVIKERDEARKKVEEAENKANGYELKLDKAVEDSKQKQETIKDLRRELEELQNAPKEVAVEKVVDKEAIEAAVKEARLKEKEAAEKKIQEAEKAKRNAESKLANAQLHDAETTQRAAMERETMLNHVKELQAKLAVASSSEMTIFKIHFEQAQESMNKMVECVTKMEEAGDAEGAGKLRNAMQRMLSSALSVIDGH